MHRDEPARLSAVRDTHERHDTRRSTQTPRNPPRIGATWLLGIAFLAIACRDDAPRARTPAVVWRTLGSWSGRGSIQTDPFISDTGSLRLRWETRNESAPGTAMFRVTVHSDVSGRPLVLAVDARGVGHDTAYVSEDPRIFFLAVESANVDWTLEAHEGVAATAPDHR